jgi:hypothetical protein
MAFTKVDVKNYYGLRVPPQTVGLIGVELLLHDNITPGQGY